MENTKDEKQKNNRRNRKKTKAGTILVVTFLLLYVPSLFHWIYGNEISTDYIRNGKIEDSINKEAVIIRDERTIVSPSDGFYLPEISEGEKIPANFKVASIINESAREFIDALNEKNVEILAAKKERGDSREIFSSDVIKLESDINKHIKQIVNKQNMNTLTDFPKIESNINELVLKRATVLGDEGAAGTYIESLYKEKANLEQKIELNKTDIIIDEPGIISFMVDGYEDMLTVEAITTITPKVLDSVLEKTLWESDLDTKEGEPFSKLIRGLHYYIAVNVDTETAQYIDINKEQVQLRINALDEIVWGDVYHISNNIDGQCVVVFRLDTKLPETAEFRRINIDIILNSYEGMVVATKSLFNLNIAGTEADIMLARGNIANSRRVKIIGKNEIYAIIGNLDDETGNVNLYDLYIRNPKNIREGQLVR